MQETSASDDEAAPPVSAVQLQPFDEAAALEAELEGQATPSHATSADGLPAEMSDDEDGAQLAGEDDGDTSSDGDDEEAGDNAADGAAAARAHPTSEDRAEARVRKAAAVFEGGVRALKRRSDSDHKQQVGHHSEPACSSA